MDEPSQSSKVKFLIDGSDEKGQLTLAHAAQGKTLSTLSRWWELIRQSEDDESIRR